MKTAIEKMARESRIDVYGLGCPHDKFVAALERFAALVIANHPPQSYMTWQDGHAAGVAVERERILKQIAVLHDTLSLAADPGTLKAKGQG